VIGECNVTNTITGTLAGNILTPGVYCISDEAKTGVLTLNGPANGTWTFKVNQTADGALTGTNFSVIMAGGGQACNVTWWVAQDSTMTDSTFVGTILAGAAITMTRGTLAGRAFAKEAVTITGTTVIGCGALSSPTSCKPKKHHKDHSSKDDDDDDDSGNRGRKGGKK
jgi:hypothetical protein